MTLVCQWRQWVLSDQMKPCYVQALRNYEPLSRFFRRGGFRCPQQIFAPALAKLGRFDEAEAEFKAGLKYCLKVGDSPGIVWLNTDYTELLLDRDAPGDRSQAIALRDETVSMAAELGMKPHLGMLARLYGASGCSGTGTGSRYDGALS